MTDEEFLRYLKRKVGLCYDCRHVEFLGDGGVYCQKKRLMIYSKVKKCQYYEKE